jgi:hypothetical protein
MSDPVFGPEAKRALSAVLDEIIPPTPDGSLPGAGALGLGSYVEEKLGAAGAAIAEGLAVLDQLAADRGAESYATAQAEDRLPLLKELAERDPGFLGGLIFHTYGGYYHSPRVVEVLGLESWPPHPKGYELEPGDLSLLDRVRAGPKLYRDV